MNSIISWVGGKKALRELIYERLPKEYERYIEVFGGGGWVLFGKSPDSRCLEVYNDFNANLANLFFCVKERPVAFLLELGFLPLNSRDEFTVLRNFISKKEFTKSCLKKELSLAQYHLREPEFEEVKAILTENAEITDVKRAAAFFKLIRYSYGSGCRTYSCQPFDVRKAFFLIWEANRRLANTVIENKDFEALIRQYDRSNAFFYCDPPYYQTEGHYEVEFLKKDHVRLKDTLTQIDGKFLVSYNDCEYIRNLYDSFHIESVARLNNMAQRYESGSEYLEVFISNYDTSERRRNMPIQMELFDLDGREKTCPELGEED